MNITKKNNYLHITDIDSLADAVSVCCKEYDNDFFAAVFEGIKEPLTPEEKKLLADVPFITAVYSDSLTMPAEDLLCFDLRFSADTFKTDRETAKKLSEEKKFSVLFSDKRAYALKEFAENSDADETELEYFSVTAENFDDYFKRIYKDKTPFQIKILTECLVSLRTGDAETGFAKESENFYKLARVITKE
ncbi:hypothetical protein [Ruminococcus sp. HUN007]|uniref:hypothetical protein n=1 Tax=Ruminococcus sp. HUN007 TaxID=1514668 RepID=UPI0005D2720A|nr:hypothetical protein [Ruminococcus sp. HUN007]